MKKHLKFCNLIQLGVENTLFILMDVKKENSPSTNLKMWFQEILSLS